MSAWRHEPMTDKEEVELVKLLHLWSDGEICIRDIIKRTGRHYEFLRRLVEKHNISRPRRFSY